MYCSTGHHSHPEPGHQSQWCYGVWKSATELKVTFITRQTARRHSIRTAALLLYFMAFLILGVLFQGGLNKDTVLSGRNGGHFHIAVTEVQCCASLSENFMHCSEYSPVASQQGGSQLESQVWPLGVEFVCSPHAFVDFPAGTPASSHHSET